METKELSLFGKLALNKFYKYMAYVAGIILIASIFFDIKGGLEQAFVQKTALKIIILCLVLWIIDDIFTSILAFIDYSHQESYGRGSHKDDITGAIVFYYIITVVVFVIGLLIIFG